jgi:hypothetical protein
VFAITDVVSIIVVVVGVWAVLVTAAIGIVVDLASAAVVVVVAAAAVSDVENKSKEILFEMSNFWFPIGKKRPLLTSVSFLSKVSISGIPRF